MAGLAFSSQMPPELGSGFKHTFINQAIEGPSLPFQFHILWERMAGLRSCAHRVCVCVCVCVCVSPYIQEEGEEDQLWAYDREEPLYSVTS